MCILGDRAYPANMRQATHPTEPAYTACRSRVVDEVEVCRATPLGPGSDKVSQPTPGFR
jgi:hypothetical protein